MASYFQTYQETPSSAIEQNLAQDKRPGDTGGPLLPFYLLGGSHFEALVYQLKRLECPNNGYVQMMTGTADRGRDIVVFQNGVPAQIVQCKNYNTRMDQAELRAELLKLALNVFQEPSILGTKTISYELWCPGDLTEPAARLFSSWPSKWTESELAIKEDMAKLVKRYASFSDLTWDKVRSFVMDAFPNLLRVKSVANADITVLIRNQPDIYGRFFGGYVLLSEEALDSKLDPILTHMRYLGDEEAKYIIDRILAFKANERTVHPQSIIFGIKPELLSKFNQEEWRALITHTLGGAFSLIQMVWNVAVRVEAELLTEFRCSVNPHNCMPLVLGFLLRLSMLSKTLGKSILSKVMRYDTTLPLEERFRSHAQEVGVMLYPQDESAREQLVHFLMLDFELHKEKIQHLYDRYMEIIPSEILLVSDMRSMIQHPVLVRRMIEETQQMDRLRGSSTIPQ